MSAIPTPPPTGMPAPESSSIPVASSRLRNGGILPRPRARSLRPGSKKEDLVRRFTEQQFMRISRRWVKKFTDPSDDDDSSGDAVVGYMSFKEVCTDLDEIINVVWMSGTPSLQTPVLLNAANEFASFVGDFPPAPAVTFALLFKLDHCFASLLAGKDIESGEPLPGFENGLRAGMSTTDMIRCQSLVEQTRLLMSQVMSREGRGGKGDEETQDEETQDEETGDEETGDEESQYEDTHDEGGFAIDSYDDGADRVIIDVDGYDDDDDANENENDELYIGVGRVYQKSIVLLHERLGIGLEQAR